MNGDLVRLTEMDGTTTQYCRIYGTGGDTLTIRDSRGKDTVILSDAAGREIKRTDQDGKVTTTSYDAMTGQPSCVTTPDGKQMWYIYDFRGAWFGGMARPSSP